MDIAQFAGSEHFLRETTAVSQHVRTSPRVAGVEEILLPGDPERREKARRQKAGLTLDDGTWGQLTDVAGKLKVAVPK